MITEEIRQEHLRALAELDCTRPNWRLGQTLSNLAMAAGRLDAGGMWDLKDDKAFDAARQLLGQQAEATTAGL